VEHVQAHRLLTVTVVKSSAEQVILLTHVLCVAEVAELDGAIQIVQVDPILVMAAAMVATEEE
jgi:hypothetical protein